MRKEIVKTVVSTVYICDHKDCEVDVSICVVHKMCAGCDNHFCEDHLFQYGSDDDFEILCQYCIDIYEDLLSPLKSEIHNLEKKNDTIYKKIDTIQDKITKLCKDNHKKRLKEKKVKF